MNLPPIIRRLSVALLAACCLAVWDTVQSHLWAAQEPPPPSRESVASQLANVKRLINVSSGAKRIEFSGEPAARARRAAATDLFNRAEATYETGNYAEADRLLKEATRTMFEAVRLAGAENIIAEKRRNDFDVRADSVEVLLGALRRIAAEKGKEAEVAPRAAQVERELADARSLMEAGQLEDGTARLEGAYDKAKRAVEELRRGDTLVRSLNFATPEEEYRYELDRNDTHSMLVTVLLEQKRETAAIDAMVERYVSRAQALRSEAERQAGGGDFKTAIRTLEDSTKELVRAIRSAGVYIPG